MVQRLNQLATEMVGDGGDPDVFFVTDKGNVVTVSTSYAVARAHWEKLRDRFPRAECALENRNYGVISSVEPHEDDSTRLVVRDDDRDFRHWRRERKQRQRQGATASRNVVV